MKIEAGKYYRTRDGWKVGPMMLGRDADSTSYRWTDRDNSLGQWDDTGEDGHATSSEDSIDDLIAEWTDTPTLWCDMTAEEKGALLLAHHEGKVIEWSYFLPWTTNNSTAKGGVPCWDGNCAYRVKPDPKRETVALWWGSWRFGSAEGPDGATHRITFDLIDGEPDPSTIRMESL
jgi:hypothetical protein